MKDERKTKKQLINELIELRQQVDELEKTKTKHKLAEDELRNTKEYLEKLTNALPDMIFTVKFPERTHEYLNSSGERILGYNNQECIGKSTRMFYANEDEFIDLGKKLITAIEHGKEIVYTEHLLKRKNGEVFPGELTITFLKEDGKVTRIIGIVRDITERKQAEEALQFTRFSLDNAVDTMVCVDHDGRFIDVNDAFCRSVGYSREELRSMSVHDIDPNYPTELWPEFWEKLKQGGSLTFESCHRTKEGKVFPVEITANYFEYNGKEYHCSFARDITERKRAEEALRKAEEKYRSIFDNAVEGIFQTTHEGLILSANPALARIFGYDSPEDIINSVTDIGRQLYVDPEKRKEHLRLLNEKGAVKNFEAQMYQKDGSILWVSINTRIVRDDAGNPLFFEGFVEDITERKQAEKEREKLIAELQEALKNIKTLSSLLPICMSCKKIRDDKGYWNQIEEYITEHTDTLFSHGLCPDCLKIMYADFDKKNE